MGVKRGTLRWHKFGVGFRRGDFGFQGILEKVKRGLKRGDRLNLYCDVKVLINVAVNGSG